MTKNSSMILTLSCFDQPGIVALVASEIFKAGGNIKEAKQFEDVKNGQFFMRIEFDAPWSETGSNSFLNALRAHPILTKADLRIRPQDQKKRVMIMVSKFDHCLADLLYRYRLGELAMEITAIVSNHPKTVLNFDYEDPIPYYHLPVTRDTKPQQENQLRSLIEETNTDLVVLARYMQILSNDMSAYLSGRCINIHHSFLPGFKGAKPYHQAYERGVKMIGATAHYVTSDLDEGPIIAQAVEDVNHAHTPADLIQKGREIERRVLSRAVSLHLEDRAMLNGARTVIFEE